MRILELILGVLGLNLCAAGGLYALYYLYSAGPSLQQHIWPLPGGYLMEMNILGVIGLAGVVLDRERSSPRWGKLSWAVAGALGAMAVLGAWSIGWLYAPAAAAFAGAGVVADRRRGRSVVRNLGLVVLAAVVQAGVMVTAIFILR